MANHPFRWISIKFPHPFLLASAACGIVLGACQAANPALPAGSPTGPVRTTAPATFAAPPVLTTAMLIPPTPAVATSTTPPVAAAATLVPADSDAPAAGICAEAEGEWASVQIAPDVPSPRCLKVTGEQRLKVINGTQAVVQVRLGEFALELQPGQEGALDTPFGQYLAPGVHQMLASPYSGPELWLVEK